MLAQRELVLRLRFFLQFADGGALAVEFRFVPLPSGAEPRADENEERDDDRPIFRRFRFFARMQQVDRRTILRTFGQQHPQKGRETPRVLRFQRLQLHAGNAERVRKFQLDFFAFQLARQMFAELQRSDDDARRVLFVFADLRNRRVFVGVGIVVIDARRSGAQRRRVGEEQRLADGGVFRQIGDPDRQRSGDFLANPPRQRGRRQVGRNLKRTEIKDVFLRVAKSQVDFVAERLNQERRFGERQFAEIGAQKLGQRRFAQLDFRRGPRRADQRFANAALFVPSDRDGDDRTRPDARRRSKGQVVERLRFRVESRPFAQRLIQDEFRRFRVGRQRNGRVKNVEVAALRRINDGRRADAVFAQQIFQRRRQRRRFERFALFPSRRRNDARVVVFLFFVVFVENRRFLHPGGLDDFNRRIVVLVVFRRDVLAVDRRRNKSGVLVFVVRFLVRFGDRGGRVDDRSGTRFPNDQPIFLNGTERKPRLDAVPIDCQNARHLVVVSSESVRFRFLFSCLRAGRRRAASNASTLFSRFSIFSPLETALAAPVFARRRVETKRRL